MQGRVSDFQCEKIMCSPLVHPPKVWKNSACWDVHHDVMKNLPVSHCCFFYVCYVSTGVDR